MQIYTGIQPRWREWVKEGEYECIIIIASIASASMPCQHASYVSINGDYLTNPSENRHYQL